MSHHGRLKRRRPQRPRRHISAHAGIAVASACDDCAHLIGGAEQTTPG